MGFLDVEGHRCIMDIKRDKKKQKQLVPFESETSQHENNHPGMHRV